MNNVQHKTEQRSERDTTVRRRQELHDRLLAAAEAEIADAGLANLRARSLAEAVGCSVGAIYGVFPDLDALILAVNGRTLDAIDATMRAAGPGRGPADYLARLADAYLGYAVGHRHRWSALFQHQMPEGRPIAPWYAERQVAAFSHVEAPLAALRPGMTAKKRALLARTLFAAVHGMVELGLTEKVIAMPLPVLREQVRVIVQAIAKGLAHP